MSHAYAAALSVCTAALLGLAVPAQGKFSNFETPHVKPITTTRLIDGAGTLDVVLVCNSADNSVEIYGAAAPYPFYQRVHVGLGPCSVVWNATQSCFYTTNFDGDTISRIRLNLVNGAPVARIVDTQYVGDQPSHIAFDPTGSIGVVSLSGSSESLVFDASTLDIQYQRVLSASDPTLQTVGQAFQIGQFGPVAVKAPRQLEVLPDGRAFALNFMAETDTLVDVDLWFADPAMTPPSGVEGFFVGDMGSTHQAFAINSSADTMIVVGMRALNLTASTEANVAALPFGFAESRMWVLDLTPGQAPTVVAEATPGALPTVPLMSRNLNRDYATAAGSPVSKQNALSQPCDVALVETPTGGIKHIAITAFHSDRVTILTPNATVNGGYDETQIDIPVSSGASYSTAGPSGITFDDNTGLLYVTCRLDSTLHVIEPVAGTLLASMQLNNDPTPDYIRRGRAFLYDADLTSGTGFVSCATCHVNGTTDALAWDLSDTSNNPVPAPLEALSFDGDPLRFGTFPPFKGPIVTQTLQGLVNSEVEQGQELMTNAPYHWRGDRATFQDFNPAFVGLLGRSAQLTSSEMDQYTQFINSILHPPNALQPLDRKVSGTLGTEPDDPATATGGKLGLQVFHNFSTLTRLQEQQSCASCHALPEGSDNVLTEFFEFPSLNFHPLETAALRNLRPREARLQFNNSTERFNETVISVATIGITHDGMPLAQTSGAGLLNANLEHLSINHFLGESGFNFPTPAAQAAVIQYTRQFDTGTAPAVGISYALGSSVGFNHSVMDFFEDQVEDANVGLAVIARTGTNHRGFYYDPTQSPPYVEEGTTTRLSRAAIEAMAHVADSTVIVQSTPLGNDRRIASSTGIATQLSGPAPSNVSIEPMAPMSYHTDIPLFDDRLMVDNVANPTMVTARPVTSEWALRQLQISVLGAFGVDTMHHEPPRRFRVTGDDIRRGAKLIVMIPTTNPGALPVQELELNLYPTGYEINNRNIWETEEELDPAMTFALLNGGPFAPDVQRTLDRQFTSGAVPTNLDPTTWNSFAFRIENEDGTSFTTPFAPLSIQDGR